MIGVVLVVMAGTVGLVMAISDDSDDDGDRTETAQRDSNDDGEPSDPSDTAPPSDGGDGGDVSGGGEPPPPASTAPPADVTNPPPAPTTSTTPRAPAQVAVGECVQVTENGNLLGKGSCSNGGAPYKVTAVVDPDEDCPARYTPSGDYVLCLELNVMETYCYTFPRGENGGLGGWVTPAPACRASGTVHVIDVVPGATSGDSCTTQYEWNYWYGVSAPQMVVCVMEY